MEWFQRIKTSAWLVAEIGSVSISLTTEAQATYSITAVDTEAREVGGSGTSCISGSSVYRIYGSAPGFGAVNSQAQASIEGRDMAVSLLEQGVPPSEIIDSITEFDQNAEGRQYGIVDLQGRAAGHSGADTLDYSNDIQGGVETFAYSIQGNILTGHAVLTQAESAFVSQGCDLAERLMRALEGGAENGQGDSRCTPDDVPSDAAYIQVDAFDEPRGSFLSLEVQDTFPEDPVALLREEFDAWRVTHPCPVDPPPGDGSGQAGNDGNNSGGAAEPTAGTSSGGGNDALDAESKPGAKPENGCGCEVRGSHSNAWWLMVTLPVALALRRRRRQA